MLNFKDYYKLLGEKVCSKLHTVADYEKTIYSLLGDYVNLGSDKGAIVDVDRALDLCDRIQPLYDNVLPLDVLEIIDEAHSKGKHFKNIMCHTITAERLRLYLDADLQGYDIKGVLSIDDDINNLGIDLSMYDMDLIDKFNRNNISYKLLYDEDIYKRRFEVGEFILDNADKFRKLLTSDNKEALVNVFKYQSKGNIECLRYSTIEGYALNVSNYLMGRAADGDPISKCIKEDMSYSAVKLLCGAMPQDIEVYRLLKEVDFDTEYVEVIQKYFYGKHSVQLPGTVGNLTSDMFDDLLFTISREDRSVDMDAVSKLLKEKVDFKMLKTIIQQGIEKEASCNVAAIKRIKPIFDGGRHKYLINIAKVYGMNTLTQIVKSTIAMEIAEEVFKILSLGQTIDSILSAINKADGNMHLARVMLVELVTGIKTPEKYINEINSFNFETIIRLYTAGIPLYHNVLDMCNNVYIYRISKLAYKTQDETLVEKFNEMYKISNCVAVDIYGLLLEGKQGDWIKDIHVNDIHDIHKIHFNLAIDGDAETYSLLYKKVYKESVKFINRIRKLNLKYTEDLVAKYSRECDATKLKVAIYKLNGLTDNEAEYLTKMSESCENTLLTNFNEINVSNILVAISNNFDNEYNTNNFKYVDILVDLEKQGYNVTPMQYISVTRSNNVKEDFCKIFVKVVTKTGLFLTKDYLTLDYKSVLKVLLANMVDRKDITQLNNIGLTVDTHDLIRICYLAYNNISLSNILNMNYKGNLLNRVYTYLQNVDRDYTFNVKEVNKQLEILLCDIVGRPYAELEERVIQILEENKKCILYGITQK